LRSDVSSLADEATDESEENISKPINKKVAAAEST